MELKEMIYSRKSVRKYLSAPVDAGTLEKIRTFAAEAKPLYPEIRVQSHIVTQNQVRFYFPWKTPQLMAVYSEKKPGYLENVGFMFQQLDLYLQSLGLGACWLGLGKVREAVDLHVDEGMEFVILLAFGYPDGDAAKKGPSQIRRKSLAEIADREDPRLEPARRAPSSTNSQPWQFFHREQTIDAYCSQAGKLRHKLLGEMNKIDMGIALAHMYVENPDTFRFFREEDPPEYPDYGYIGSFTI